MFLPYTQSTSSTMIKKQIREAKKKKRLYLFGAGKIGLSMLNKLNSDAKYDQWEIAGFIDNSPEKHLTRIHGVPVYKPEDLKTLETDNDYAILVTMKNIEEAVKQLEELKINDNIIRN